MGKRRWYLRDGRALSQDKAGLIATVDHSDMRGLVTDRTSLRRGAGLSLTAGIVGRNARLGIVPSTGAGSSSNEGSPQRPDPALTRSVVASLFIDVCPAMDAPWDRRLAPCRFDPVHLPPGDVPDEARQLAGDGHIRLLGILAGLEQSPVTAAQAPLCPPGDRRASADAPAALRLRCAVRSAGNR